MTTTVFSIALQQSDSFEVDLGNDHKVLGPHPIQSGTIFVPDLEGRGYYVVDRPTASSPGTAQYRIHPLGLLGDPTWTTTLQYDPEPVSQEWKGRWLEKMVEGPQNRGGPTAPRLKALFQERVDFPEFSPPVREALAGPGGSLWLRETPDL